MIASASFASSRPVCLWVRAAAFLIHTCAVTKGSSGFRPLIGKFWTARSVWTPYMASAGTSSVPSGSFSVRVADDLVVIDCRRVRRIHREVARAERLTLRCHGGGGSHHGDA